MTRYLTAEQLRITDAERDALIKILGNFRSEKSPERLTGEEFDFYLLDRLAAEFIIDKPLGFNMNFGSAVPYDPWPCGQYECGAAACIGGHVHLEMNGHDTTGHAFPVKALREARWYVDNIIDTTTGTYHALYDLFYPVGIDNWDRITPYVAAEAIENFLVKGDPNWPGTFEAHGLDPRA